jgi:hypothetical protein
LEGKFKSALNNGRIEEKMGMDGIRGKGVQGDKEIQERRRCLRKRKGRKWMRSFAAKFDRGTNT